MAAKYKIGNLVWAKMKGFPAWPGKVIEPKTEVKKPPHKKNYHFVFFYGSENYAWVPEDGIWLYAENRDKFQMSSRIPKGFKEAVEAIDDAMKCEPEEVKTADLPSIDEEIAQIFPRGAPSSPAKEGSKEASAKKPRKKSTNGEIKIKSRSSTNGNSKPSRQTEPRKKSMNGAINLKSRLSTNGNSKQNKQKEEKPEKHKNKDNIKKNKETNTPVVKKVSKRPASPHSAEKPKKPKLLAKVSASPAQNSLSPVHSQSAPSIMSPKAAVISPKSPGTTPKQSIASPSNADSLKAKSKSEENLGEVASPPGSHISTSSTQIQESILTKLSKSVIPTPMRIGFLGLGIMGQGMVMNLLRSGHEVTIWNRTAAKCREFVKAGAFRGNTPADVVQACDITFSCVADPIAVRDIVFGNSGVLQGISKGKGLVEMSTIDEETVQDVAEAITARGGVFLEAPVVGSRVPALEGQLVIIASGERKLYDDCYSCFEAMSKKSFYLGAEVGAASRMKLVNMVVMGSVMASLAEGMALAEKVGLDQEDVAEVLSLGSLSCPTINHKSQAILNSKYDTHFPLQHQQKDLRLALGLGDRVEQPLYMGAAANELFKKARRLGYGDSDMSAVYRAASA